jgi:hypothetical protein
MVTRPTLPGSRDQAAALNEREKPLDYLPALPCLSPARTNVTGGCAFPARRAIRTHKGDKNLPAR